MKKIFGCVAMLTIFTACSDDLTNGLNNEAQVIEPSTFTLTTDQSQLGGRLVVTGQQAQSKAFGVSRAAAEEAPAIPADAQPLKDQPTNWNNGVTLSANGKYYVAAGETWNGSLSCPDAGEGVDIYIAGNAETNLAWWSAGQKVNIYVLEGAEYKYALDGYDSKAHLRNGTTIKCWGKFDVAVSNMGLTIKEGGALYIYKGAMNQLLIHNGVDIAYGSALQVEGTLYSEVPVFVEGSTMFNGGDSHFVSSFYTAGNCWPKNNAKVVFEDCSTVQEETWFDGAATIDVYTMLKTNILNTINHFGGVIRLHHALLQVDDNAFINDELDQNGQPEITGVGSDYSVFNVDGTLYIDGTNGGGSYSWNTTTHEIEGLAIKSITGTVDIDATLRNGNAHWQPADTEWQKYALEERNIVLENGVILNGGTYLAGNNGCGSHGVQPPVDLVEIIEILPPTVEHKFSATGLAFNGDLLYLGWHSNPKFADEVGGYMDVIKINTYNPESSIFEQSLFSPEFRFNHTMYDDGVIYGAATSTKVGAALAEISVDNNGLIHSTPQVRRVNVTGGSANCVELINNNLVTVSGWAEGAIDMFSKTAGKPEQTFNEGAYMGKYIYKNEAQNEVIVLHDTDKGTVSIYDANGNFTTPKSSFNAGALNPRDGKNVCISDADYIYVCRGNNGLAIYTRSGNLVAETGLAANGIDVDDKYLYVAAGFGVAVYRKSDIGKTERLIPAAKTVMTTKTNLQDPTNSEGVSAAIGSSANFIRKGADGRLYVAYGVYGLRIYELR